MTNDVWFITGAGRGMGLDIAKAALAAGHKVVATGRNTDKVAQAVGESANLLVVKLDVTNPADAESAVKAVIDRFGRIDVLVNNAASFYAGYFEEITPEYYNLHGSATNIISLARFDTDKRRALAAISGPLGGNPNPGMMSRPTLRLNNWSVPPSSTSAFNATES